MTKNFFYTLLLSIVNILFPILSFPYASRILGPLGIGKVQFIISLAQYFALFAALGIPIYGITQAAKHKDDPKKLAIVFVELTGIFFIASVVLFTAYLAMVYTFPYFANNRILYFYASTLILLSFCYTDWFYAGIEKFKIITIRSVIVKILALVLLYLFVRTEADFGKYLFIIVFSILGNQLFSFLMIFRNTNFHFADIDFKKHLKPLFYIFGATLASSIYTVLDTVLLGFIADHRAVGLYTAAVKLVKLTIPFVTVMGVILIPSISNNFSKRNLTEVKQLLIYSFHFLIIVSIPVCTGMAILAPEFINAFSGSQFSEAALSMQILSFLPLLIGLGHFFSYQILIPSGRNKEIFYSMLIGVFMSLIQNFILVPFFQEKGASVANVVTELVVTLTYFYFIKKHFDFSFDWKILFQSIIAVLPFIPIILLVRQANLTAMITLFISIMGCAFTYLAVHLLIFKNNFIYDFIKPIKNKIFTDKLT